MKTSRSGSSSPNYERTERSTAEATDVVWKSLYIVGGVAALTIVVFTVIQIVVFIASPPPSTVTDWFALFEKSTLRGLLDMDLLLMADYALWALMYLALYAALRKASASFMVIATALGLLGIAIYFASNTAFDMLFLSNQYAAATTDAQRAALLAAGHAMLATYQGTAFKASYIFCSIAPLMVAVVMLRSHVFGKVTAYVGIVGNVLGFGLFVPAVGAFLSILAVVVLAAWNVLIARKLFQLGQGVSKVGAALRAPSAKVE